MDINRLIREDDYTWRLKDAGAVGEAAESAGLARRVARLHPVICIKG